MNDPQAILNRPLLPGPDGHYRFPRYSERTQKRLRAETVAKIDTHIFRLRAVSRQQCREANTEMGRWFNLLKEKVLRPGKWIAHFERVYAPAGFNLRNVERWTRRALEIDAGFDKLSNSTLAADPEALKMRFANEKARMEIGHAAPSAPKPKRFYRISISIPMSSDIQWIAADRFWRSKHRFSTATEMIETFKRRQAECGFGSTASDDREKGKNEGSQDRYS